MKREEFVPIIELGFVPIENDERMNPAALTKSAIYGVQFNGEVVAGLLITVMEAVVNLLPDSEQIEVEKETLKLFNNMVSDRHEHVEKFMLNQEDGD